MHDSELGVHNEDGGVFGDDDHDGHDDHDDEHDDAKYIKLGRQTGQTSPR